MIVIFTLELKIALLNLVWVPAMTILEEGFDEDTKFWWQEESERVKKLEKWVEQYHLWMAPNLKFLAEGQGRESYVGNYLLITYRIKENSVRYESQAR